MLISFNFLLTVDARSLVALRIGADMNTKDKQVAPKQEPKPKAKNTTMNSATSGLTDLFAMHTEVALLQSMARSKTLTIMVVVGALCFAGFILFLYKMAG